MSFNRVRSISYTLAACITVAAVSLSASASGTTAGISKVSNTTDSLESASYSTYAGVSLTVNNMLANASTVALELQQNEAEAVALEAMVESAYADIAVAQVDNYVYIRSDATAESDYVGKLYNNSAATVLDTVEAEDGEWVLLKSGDCTGYVKSEYVVQHNEELARSVSRRVATVTGDTLYVRKEASTDASIIDSIPYGDDLTVVDESTLESGWVQVSCDGGNGYVSADYVVLSTEYTVAESKEAEKARIAKEEAEKKKAREAAAKKAAASSSSSSNKTYSPATGSGGSAVVNYACQFVGNPYVYGGSSLTNGTDCSGFVMSVYAQFGVSLPHSSSALRSCGYAVDYSAMSPGDIVCYSGHVAIYAGNGTIVHASNRKTGITYSDVNYKKILAIRRIF